MKSLPLFALGLLFCGAAHAQNLASKPLRTLIISGGPDVEYNQYAIESNARYLESLTQSSRWRRIYFADGQAGSRTISTVASTPASKAARILAWVTGGDLPDDSVVTQASTLKRIDGASTKPAVLRVLGAFAQPKPGESGLLYFTGHGSPGGSQARPDYKNTTYALWNDNAISVREVAGAIANWPAQNPLFMVAVQCHSGGFANLIFQDGDPAKPLLNRDFAGFFSSTGQRMAAGCTSEVNERDYQDFTTHFFAALSGVSRDGRRITGADYDRNGLVSGSEAFAYANINDLSIDVPVATSDAYLRSLYEPNSEWHDTPYSQIIAGAQPWQKAMLNALSSALQLTGENRITDAIAVHDRLQSKTASNDDNAAMENIDQDAVDRQLSQLQTQLYRRFPGLKAAKNTAQYRAAQRRAALWLTGQSAQVDALDNAFNAYARAQGANDVRIAMLERFVRGAYSVILGQRVRREGTPAQMAEFAKLRAAEARNPLRYSAS